MARAIIHAPKTARPGELVQIRALIAHTMETGHRPDSEGRRVPRDILRRFECRYGDELVFAADLFAAIAANPTLSFFTVAQASGTLSCSWTGDNGFAHTERVEITVA